jgi:hypothetical protein
VTVEERLRDTLHRRADALPVPDDGWARIQARLDGRRRPRRALAVALAAVLPLAVATVVAIAALDREDDGQDVRVPAATTTTAVAVPETSDDRPTRVARIAAQDDFPGIWPDTTSEQMRAVEEAQGDGHQPWRTDPVSVARAYAEAVWGIDPETYPFEGFDGREGQVGFDVPGHERPYGGRLIVSQRSADCCGVWTVREAQLGHVTVHPVGFTSTRGIRSAGALRDPLVLEANSTVAGEATVELRLLGDEEAPAVDSQTLVLDGGPQRAVFHPPLDEPGLLVRIRMTDAQGRLHAHEFRVNGLADGLEDPLPAVGPGECGAVPTEGQEADVVLQAVFGAVAVGAPHSVDRVATARFVPLGVRRVADLQAEGFTVDRFTVTGDWYRERGVAAVCARAFLLRDGQLAAVRDDLFVVRRSGDRWLVDGWFAGARRDVPGSEPVRLFLWNGACGTDAAYPEVTVNVPAGEATAETVLLELLSGPTSRGLDFNANSAIRLDTRLHFVLVEDAVAVAAVSGVSDARYGACTRAAAVEQITRTLTSLPGIEEVELREGAEAFRS